MQRFFQREMVKPFALALSLIIPLLFTAGGCKTYKKTVERITPTKPAPVLSSRQGVVPPPYARPAEKSMKTSPQEAGKGGAGIAPLPGVRQEGRRSEQETKQEEKEEEEEGVAELPDAEAEELTYTVQEGDSLWKIGRKYDVSFKELAAYNDMDPNAVLSVGTKLKIPPGGTKPGSSSQEGQATESTSEETDTSGGGGGIEEKPLPPDNKYTVKKGDSLWRISRMFDVPIERIRSLNDLESDTLQIGEVLVLKEAEGESGRFEDESGSSTSEEESGGDAGGSTFDLGDRSGSEEREESGGTSGDETERATGGTSDEETSEDEDESVSFPKQLQHTVSSDETLEMIADMYETEVEKIKKANEDIDGNEDLKADMTITVPYE